VNAGKVVMAVFVDGLKPSSVCRMPFLDSFSQKRRVRTDLGYSITCHATMYSGVFPDKHHMWFIWKYAPESSPFRFLPQNQLVKCFDNLASRYFMGKMVRLFSGNTSYAGVGVMKRSSIANWPYFDVAEDRFWDADNYLGSVPTIFELLRRNGIKYETVGLLNNKNNGGALLHIEKHHAVNRENRWIYLFIGEVDHYSHFHTQESEVTVAFLKKVDREIERVYGELIGQYDQVDFVCFSDHGHMKVEHQFDIYELFYQHKINLDDFIHITDTNYARFWLRNYKEERTVRRVIEDIPSGFILEKEHYKRYHTEMPDNRYGDLIYYLDHPYMFKKTVWGYGLRTKSIHGYLPDYVDKDGVFISNIPVESDEYITLADITPSLLDLLDIKEDFDFDGHSIWKQAIHSSG